jgi:hypothetical protein
MFSEPIRELPRSVPRSWYTGPAPLGSIGNAAHSLGHFIFGVPAPLTARERQGVQKAIEFQTTGSAYAHFHGTRPGTLGLVTHSSPLALLAWIGEKFYAWTDTE